MTFIRAQRQQRNLHFSESVSAGIGQRIRLAESADPQSLEMQKPALKPRAESSEFLKPTL